MKNKKHIKLIILALVFTTLIFVKPIRAEIATVINLLSSMDMDAIKTYILSFGILAPIVSFLLMIFQSLAAPLPAFLITFANASLFGWIRGALLSWSSAMVGALLCFYISKLLGRQVIEKLTSKFALEGMDSFFEKYGKHAVLIARLLPFLSFDVVSYAAGLTSMSTASFLLATGLGQLPATLIYSYVGEMLTGGTKKLLFGLLILSSLGILALLVRKFISDKEQNTTERATIYEDKA